MLKLKPLIFILFILTGQCIAQSKSSDFKVWQLTSYSGNVGLMSFYRVQKRILNNVVDYSKYPFIYGNLSLYTKNYIVHPNFLLLDIGGEYNPGISRQTYTVSPDRSEVLTLKKLDVRATLFNQKPMSFGAHFIIGQNFINREYITSLKTDSKQWGLNYNYRNKILPLSVSYSDRKWDQLETETGRTFRFRQNDLQARIRRSFTNNGDDHELRYTQYRFFREDQNLIQTNNLNDNLILNNLFYFDSDKKYMFRSSVTHLNQRGNITQKRFQAFETINFRLPYKFRFTGNYDFTKNSQETQEYKQNRIRVGLDHELFSSLRTGVFYEYFKTDHSAYNETNTRLGGTVNYLKKIPANGTLSLIYSFRRHNQNVISNPDSLVIVIDEDQVLSDGDIVLLDRPYVNLASVVVKDLTGSFIYQENFDYLLIERNEFVEIQRIPGGQITNNSTILVDYVAAQIGSYNFNSDTQSFTIRITLFNRLLEFYYTLGIQDYNNIESAELLTLNYYNRNIYGGRIQIGFFSGGVEMDDYRSTIVPYLKMRYFLQVSGNIGKKILLSLNGDLSDLTLTGTNTDQLYANIFGKIIYQFKPQTKLNFDIGYRKQVGEEINLDLITSRLEFNTIYRTLYIKVGTEVYKRNYVGEQINFGGIYFQIDRKF